MGLYSEKEHTDLVALLKNYNWKEVVLIGEEFEAVYSTYKYFKTTAEAQQYFQSNNYSKAQILIKGSRGLALEKLLS